MIQQLYTRDMTRAEWLEERKHSLGGSDMGAICGLNRYSTPYSVWAEKTGRMPDKPDNEAMRQGRDLEAYVAERFEEASGKAVRRLNYILRNDKAPHLHANIDRKIVGEHAGLECKTASALSAKNYAGGNFPEHYYVQCVSYLAVTEWERWYLAVVVLGKSFHVYMMTTIPDDPVPEWCEGSVYVSPEEIEIVRTMAEDFWTSYIIPDEAPPVDGEDATGDVLRTIYADANDETVNLFGRASLLDELQQREEEIKQLKKLNDEIRQTIQQDMGAASSAFCDGWKATWKAQTRSTFQAKEFAKAHPEIDMTPFYKESTSRVFKIKEDK